MRIFIVGLSLLAASCGSQTPEGKPNGKTVTPIITLAVSPLEMTAKAALEKRVRETRAAEALEKRVKGAMEIVLVDPFSARYRALRYGRSGSVCGQVNGKNRMGGYVGFKDFVVGKDGKTVWISRQTDGVETELYSSFAEAYVNVCATKTQIARFKAITAPPTYYPDYEYDAASSATDAANTASQAAVDAAAEAAEAARKM